MKFDDVLYALMHGKRITRTSWKKDVYVHYHDPCRTFFMHTYDELIKLEGITLYPEWIIAEDWMVIE